MTLPRYMLRIVGSRILAALLVLVAILQILDLLDVTTDILERKLGVAGVLYYVTLRLPLLVEQVAPLAVLAGCLFAFAQLARENAVVALRSTGVSAYQLVVMTAPAVLAVVVLHFVSVQWLTPRAGQALEAWWAQSAPADEKADNDPRSFRVGTDIVVARASDESGRRLADVMIYRRDAQGRLTERLRAPAAEFVDDGWRLAQPSFEVLGASGIQHGRAAAMTWRPGPEPQDIREIFLMGSDPAPGSARRALSGGVSVRPPSFYETALQRGWAAPLSALVMLVLASPVLLVNFRSGGTRTLVSCLGVGLLFFVADGVLSALGEGGEIPPALGAWAALAIFAAAGGSALLHKEG